MQHNEAIVKALAACEQARKEVVRVVAEAYPVGTVLIVEDGRRTIHLQVTQVCDCWWASSPGRVIGVNIATGKKREFDVRSITGVRHA